MQKNINRKNRDYVYGIWQYKIFSIKNNLWGENIGQTLVMYKDLEKG